MAIQDAGLPFRALVVTLAGAVGFVSGATALSMEAPCEDLDADGYVAGPGCAVQEDCNDQSAAIRPGVEESCNGWDDDCDGELDEGCDRVCEDFGLNRRVFLNDNAGQPRITTAERGWAVIFDDNPQVATRLDVHGKRIAPETVFVSVSSRTRGIVWTGLEMVVSWQTLDSPDPENSGLFLRRLGPWGKPSLPPVPLAEEGHFLEDLDWTGSELVVLWADLSPFPNLDGVRLHRVGPDGELRNNGVYVSEERWSDSRLAWNGQRYGWCYRKSDDATTTSDLFFQPLDAYGVASGPEVRLTDHRPAPFTFASFPRILHRRPDSGFAVAWIDDRTGEDQVWFALLDADGNLLPPGEVQISAASPDGVSATFPDVAWTGEEFFVVWGEAVFPGGCGPAGPLVAARVSAAGALLERGTLVEGFCNTSAHVAWNGRNFGVIFAQHEDFPFGQPDVEFVEVGCGCSTDGDGDGALPCEGGDCDDADPNVGPQENEVCTDGIDNDCDDLVDCNDPDCVQSGNAPQETAGLSWSADKLTLSWGADSRASKYDVARGLLDELRGMENFYWTECFAFGTTATSVMDTEVPAPGEAFYYQVRGRAKTCLLGPWGTTLREDTLQGCP